MKNMTRSEWIAVCTGLALVTYLFFSGPLLNLFTNKVPNSKVTTMSQAQTGFTSEDIIVGQGPIAERGNKITAHYVGTLENGQVFDSSRDRNAPIEFVLGVGQVIRGWDEGLIGMRVGGKRILKITPEFGYGSRAVGAIPANSTLIFEVELLDAKKSQ